MLESLDFLVRPFPSAEAFLAAEDFTDVGADADAALQRRLLERGAFGYIVKPFEERDLLAAVAASQAGGEPWVSARPAAGNIVISGIAGNCKPPVRSNRSRGPGGDGESLR
jgi:hypothetical protein